jgi:hypothetical protein
MAMTAARSVPIRTVFMVDVPSQVQCHIPDADCSAQTDANHEMADMAADY